MSDFVTRFAPSPTGGLHLGHVASALEVWKTAEAAGGHVLLRLEDIDDTRCKPEFADGILEDLAWLGLAHHGPIRRQSDHFDSYQEALAKLIGRGLCYRCFKTRKEVLADITRAPHHSGPVYIGEPLPPDEENKRIASGNPFAWRLSLARARDTLGKDFDALSYPFRHGNGQSGHMVVNPNQYGDVVLARKDTPTSYHLASTHDDALQGVTHIIRGQDLEAVTGIHVLLQALMGWPTPVYTHHDLLTGPDGQRLAKRHHAPTIAALRANGYTPQSVRIMATLA